MNQIKFWVDDRTRELIILDVKTERKIVLKQQKQIDQFLFLYGMQFENLDGVTVALDHFDVFHR